jgi:mannose-6-phosphate isomerase-like protein (cupin superfamily)
MYYLTMVNRNYHLAEEMWHTRRIPAATTNGVVSATVIDFFGALITPKATAASTGGAIDVAEQIVPADLPTPLHVHHREDERLYVLDGVVAFRLGAETFVAQPGAFVRLPRDIAQAFRVRSEIPARTLVLGLPSGLAASYAEVGARASPSATAVLRPVDLPRLVHVGASYGIEVLGAPPADV